ncbi:chromate transporter [Clostridium nigeriense]|uniref:chromate transporter n=1 Tax=Clostridium nigeriense TaxID=1805470 RepID=UPI000830E136|nr:chromate transporter [Clostridium nigeriense]
MIKLLITLFITFWQIGSFSIGGGYAIMPLIQEEIVNKFGWLTIQEFTDIITISQMTPGPLSINASTFVGIRIAGTLGAIVATFACVITGVFLSIFLFNFFKKHNDVEEISNILKGLRSTSIGLITASASTIIIIALLGRSTLQGSLNNFNIIAAIVFSISLFLLRKYKFNPLTIILITGFLGLFFYI